MNSLTQNDATEKQHTSVDCLLNITTEHQKEWTEGSLVHSGIVELNVRSLCRGEIFDYLTPNPRRLNGGRLCNKHLAQYEKCENSSGWWVSGINPHTWEREETWGRFKPDIKSAIAQSEWDGKNAKYLSPQLGKGSSQIILLDVPAEIQTAIAERYQVEIDDENFWRWVSLHPEIPIYITEGEKKAGAGLTKGFVTIGIPGCWMGTRNTNGIHHLHPFLEPFMHPKREIILIPDNDPNPESKNYTYKAFATLGRTMQNRVKSVKVSELPDHYQKMGLDDYLVGGGTMDNIAERALLLAQWERLIQQSASDDFRNYFCDKFFNRILFIGELSSWYAYEKGKDSKPGVWGQVSDHSIRALVQQEMTRRGQQVTANSVSNLVKVCQYDERMYRNHFPETPAHWTPFSNCILNRKTKQIIEHHPENFLLWSLPRKYNPQATDWTGIYNWLMFKNGGDESLTQIDIAYCYAVINMSVAQLQRTYLGIGEPGSGKGTLQLLWELLVGEDNILSTTLDRFCKNRFESARAFGKRLILFDDADKVKEDLQIYKSITGGSRIPYELKGINTQRASYLFTGMIATFANYDPFTLKRDDAGALSRRHIPMPFNQPIPIGRQKNMSPVFEKYLDGFINHLLTLDDEGVTRLLKGSHINTTVSHLKWEQRYDSDFMFAAINDLFIFDSTASIEVGAKLVDSDPMLSPTKAYPAVLKYLEAKGYWNGKGKPPIDGNRFSRKFTALTKEMGYQVLAKKGGAKNVSCLFGVRLRQTYDTEPTFLERLEAEKPDLEANSFRLEVEEEAENSLLDWVTEAPEAPPRKSENQKSKNNFSDRQVQELDLKSDDSTMPKPDLDAGEPPVNESDTSLNEMSKSKPDIYGGEPPVEESDIMADETPKAAPKSKNNFSVTPTETEQLPASDNSETPSKQGIAASGSASERKQITSDMPPETQPTQPKFKVGDRVDFNNMKGEIATGEILEVNEKDQVLTLRLADGTEKSIYMERVSD